MKNNTGIGNKKGKLTDHFIVKLIFITVVALVISLCVFLVSVILDVTSDDKEGGDATNGDGTIKIDPSQYTVLDSISDNQLYSGDLIIVDGKNPLKKSSDNATTVSLGSMDRPKTPAGSKYKVAYIIMETDKYKGTSEAAKALNNMLTAFCKTKTIDTSTDEYLAVTMAKGGDGATSIYDSGLVFKLGYETAEDKIEPLYGKDTYKWIYENAHKYGFVRYSSSKNADEASVFRYVGVAHAAKMKNEGKTLSEYIDIIRSKTYTEPLQVVGGDGKTYYVYYSEKGADLYVPQNYSYEISGDNVGGYIVTVDASKKK